MHHSVSIIFDMSLFFSISYKKLCFSPCLSAPASESQVERPLNVEEPGDVLQKSQLEAIGTIYLLA